MRKTMPFLALLFTLVGGAWFAPPVHAAPTPSPTVVTQERTARTPTAQEAARYATREQQQAKKLEKFQGGDVVLITSTAAAILIGVLIVLVLI